MTVEGFLTVIATHCRCPQAAGPRGCVHLGGEPGEHHLRGVCLPQCHNLVVPRWSAAAKLQLQQHQDLQQPLCQLPGGKRGTGQRQGRKGSLTIDRLLNAAKILLASLACPELGAISWRRTRASAQPLCLLGNPRAWKTECLLPQPLLCSPLWLKAWVEPMIPALLLLFFANLIQ